MNLDGRKIDVTELEARLISVMSVMNVKPDR